MDKVSIIVPIYNAEKYLKKCLDCIVTQTYKELEIILIDDGSIDNSLNICKEYAKYDGRIKIIHNKNHGVSYSRNCGIKIATGKYITFIDSDDTVSKDYIKELISVNKYNDFDLVICALRHKMVYGKKIVSKDIVLDNENSLSGNIKKDYRFLLEYLLAPYLKLFKRCIINKYNILFPEDLLLSEDQVFNREYIKHVRKYKFINKCLYNYYHRNNNSLSVRTSNKCWESDIKNIILMKNFFETEEIEGGTTLLVNHAVCLLDKYAVESGFIDGYVNFCKKYKELKSITDFNCKIFTWKRRLIVNFLKRNIILPIYIYYFFKHKQ